MSSMEEVLMGLRRDGGRQGQGQGQAAGGRGMEALFHGHYPPPLQRNGAGAADAGVAGAGQRGGGAAGGPPAALVVEEVGLMQETITKGGTQRQVFIAVKNGPFSVKVSLRPGAGCGGAGLASLGEIALDVVLFYDSREGEDQFKEVDFVKERPVLWKEVKGSGSERSVTLDARIKVLTSHHEGSLFRVGVQAIDKASGFACSPPLRAFTGPIKVISKIEPHVKRNVTRKRMLNDRLVELVNKIDRQQEANDKLLRAYVASTRAHGPRPSAWPSADEDRRRDAEEQEHRRQAEEQEQRRRSGGSALEEADPWAALQGQFQAPAGSATASGSGSGSEEGRGMRGAAGGTPEFERAFERFLAVYTTLSLDDKAAKIRRLARPAPGQRARASAIAEFVRCLGQEKERAGQASGSSCECRVCPYQRELSRIDDFYKDFLGNQEEFSVV